MLSAGQTATEHTPHTHQYLGEGRGRTIEVEQRVVVVWAADSNLALAHVACIAAHGGHVALLAFVMLAVVAAALALHQH